MLWHCMHVAMSIENPGTYARASSSRRSGSRGVSAWDLRDQRAAKAISQAGDAKVSSHDALRVHSFRLRTHRVLAPFSRGLQLLLVCPKTSVRIFRPLPFTDPSLQSSCISAQQRTLLRTYVRTCVRMYVRTCVMYLCMNLRTCVNACMRACVLACVFTCVCT